MARHEGQTVRLEDMETTANRTFVAHDVELTTCLYIVCDMAYVDKQFLFDYDEQSYAPHARRSYRFKPAVVVARQMTFHSTEPFLKIFTLLETYRIDVNPRPGHHGAQLIKIIRRLSRGSIERRGVDSQFSIIAPNSTPTFFLQGSSVRQVFPYPGMVDERIPCTRRRKCENQRGKCENKRAKCSK